MSGGGDLFEVFDVSMLKEEEFLSNHNSYLCIYTFFYKAILFLYISKFQKKASSFHINFFIFFLIF